MYSLIIPVYKNEGSLPDLLRALSEMNSTLNSNLEVVFVVDGSPDRSFQILSDALPALPFSAQLLLHSRNFGSFAAVRTGLGAARGTLFGVMAADLQEPPELMLECFSVLASEPYDVVVGTRESREDPLLSKLFSSVFWWLYRKLVHPEVPSGGVDVFACNSDFKVQLLSLNESNTSLIGLIYWLGYRRKTVSYRRLERQHGKSAWTFKRKVKYLADSVFGFTDLPIRLLITAGMGGILLSLVIALSVTAAKLTGTIEIPGYAATVVIISFFAGLNSLGLGVIGSYVWRAFENTKARPQALVLLEQKNDRERQV